MGDIKLRLLIFIIVINRPRLISKFFNLFRFSSNIHLPVPSSCRRRQRLSESFFMPVSSEHLHALFKVGVTGRIKVSIRTRFLVGIESQNLKNGCIYICSPLPEK